jgi:hypothetical protein
MLHAVLREDLLQAVLPEPQKTLKTLQAVLPEPQKMLQAVL